MPPLRAVSCDMSLAFIKGTRENLWIAAGTFDKFHVTKGLRDAMEKVRRSHWRTGKTVKSGRWPLLKNPENFTANQREQLTDITTRNAALVSRPRGSLHHPWPRPTPGVLRDA